MTRLAKGLRSTGFLLAVAFAFLAGYDYDQVVRREQTTAQRATLLYSAVKRHDEGALSEFAGPTVLCWLREQYRMFGPVTAFHVAEVDAAPLGGTPGFVQLQVTRGRTVHPETLEDYGEDVFNYAHVDPANSTVNDGCIGAD